MHALDRFERAGHVGAQDNWSCVQWMLLQANVGYQAIVAKVDDAQMQPRQLFQVHVIYGRVQCT